eukprot:scaffold4120_cov400-Prasinococcus_capsulatus_cf.AAC.11
MGGRCYGRCLRHRKRRPTDACSRCPRRSAPTPLLHTNGSAGQGSQAQRGSRFTSLACNLGTDRHGLVVRVSHTLSTMLVGHAARPTCLAH